MLRDLKIGTRVLGGFGVLIVLIAGKAVTCLFFIARLNENTAVIHAGRMEAIQQLRSIPAVRVTPSANRAANDGAADTRAWLELHERSAIADYASATATYRLVKALILIGAPLMVLFCPRWRSPSRGISPQGSH